MIPIITTGKTDVNPVQHGRKLVQSYVLAHVILPGAKKGGDTITTAQVVLLKRLRQSADLRASVAPKATDAPYTEGNFGPS
jgi:hypothetical protein